MRHLTPTLRNLFAALAFAGLALAACGGDDDDTTADTGSTPSDTSDAGDSGDGDAASGPVTIVDFSYDPISVTAAAGEDVTFTNEDGTAHTATAKDNSFNSGNIAAGESGTITAPDAAGEYEYFCAFHPFMKATLIVE